MVDRTGGPGRGVPPPRTGPATDRDFDGILEAAERFHGYAAPGVLVGCYMVAAARAPLPGGILFDAICETTWCLPDAVQLMTPCTVGNGWLHVLDLGLFAVTLYDKATGKGTRAYLEPESLEAWPDLLGWYLKDKPKREQDSEAIRRQIREAGPRICRTASVEVRPEFLEKRSKGAVRICPRCGEAYPGRHGHACRKCQGASPYRVSPAEPGAGSGGARPPGRELP